MTDNMPQLFGILVIGIWNLFGIWDLEFGISSGRYFGPAYLVNDIVPAGLFSVHDKGAPVEG
jgi:hypothetical protein